MARIVAASAALVGWGGLALQLWLIVGNLGLPMGLWRFVGYFTILTNLGTAIVASAVALGSTGRLASPRARLMAATAIALVGAVYSLALRNLWNPAGLQKLADIALHDAAPLLFLAAWLLAPHPGLRWREIGWALVPPLLYALYALGRGQFDGWYAYWFLDPSQQTPVQLLAAIALLAVAVTLIAGLLVLIDRILANRGAANRMAATQA